MEAPPKARWTPDDDLRDLGAGFTRAYYRASTNICTYPIFIVIYIRETCDLYIQFGHFAKKRALSISYRLGIETLFII